MILQYVIVMLIIVVITIHTLSTGHCLAQPRVSRNSYLKPCDPNLESTCAHIHAYKKKLHAYRLHVFIYLSCRYAVIEMCVCNFLYRVYCKRYGIYENIEKSELTFA